MRWPKRRAGALWTDCFVSRVALECGERCCEITSALFPLFLDDSKQETLSLTVMEWTAQR